MDKGEWPLLNALMDDCGIDGRMKEDIMKCVRFHSFPAAGLLIGAFMVGLGMEKLAPKPGERLYAVSETRKCAPDALQVLCGCTIGNGQLRVIDIGRFAIAINHQSDREYAEGVRVYVDREKVGRYKVLNLWYTNDPSFHIRPDTDALLKDILMAGRDILSYEPIKVKVVKKQKWGSATCAECGEMVPESTLVEGKCRGCGSLSYYIKA